MVQCITGFLTEWDSKVAFLILRCWDERYSFNSHIFFFLFPNKSSIRVRFGRMFLKLTSFQIIIF